MTVDELHRLPWKMRSHMALAHEHASVYEAEVEGLHIAKCVHTERIGYYGSGRSHAHYVIGNVPKVHKARKSAVKRINELPASRRRMY